MNTSPLTRAERVHAHRSHGRDLLAEADLAYLKYKQVTDGDWATHAQLAAALAMAHEMVARGLERPA